MARITAERLASYLERSGYVLMKRPPMGDLARFGRGPKPEPPGIA